MSVNAGTATGYLDLDITGFLAGLKTAQDEADKKTRNINTKVGQNLQTIGGSLTSAGKSLTKGVTVPIAAAGAAIIKTSADFESAMSKVQALSGATGNDFDALRDKAIEMGAKTKYSASESAEAFQYMALAGWGANDMLAGIEPVLKLAGAAEMDLGRASDIVTDNLTALGMGADEAAHFTDVLAVTMSSSNTDVEQMGEAFKYAAPLAGTLGYSIEDLGLALGTMANSGIKASQGGTSLRRLLLNMAKPTDAVTGAMNDLGISMYNQDGSAKSLRDVLNQLRDKMSGLTEEEQAFYGATLAGTTGVSGLMSIVNASDKDWNDLAVAIDGSKDACGEMYDVMQNNLKGQFTILKSTIESIAISFGDVLMPVITLVVEKLQGLAEKINGLDENQKAVILKVAGVVAAIGPLLLILGKTTTGVGKVFEAVGKLPQTVKMVSSTFKMLGTALGGISGPVIAVVAVIAVLVAAFKHLWDTNEGFRERMTAIWEGIKEKFETFTQGIVDRLNALGFSFEDITEVIKAVWDAFCNFLAPVFEGVFAEIETTLGAAFDIITGLFDIFSGIFTGNWDLVWQGVEEVFGGIWDSIVGTFTNAKEMLLGIADTILGWFGTSWNDMWTSIGDFFKNIWDNITTFFSNLKVNLENAFKNFIDNIVTFFKELPYNIGYILGTVIGNVVNFVTEFVQKAYEAGTNFVNNIITFFKELPGKVSSWFTQTKDKAVTFATEFPGKAREAATNFVNNIVNFFQELPGKVSTWFNNTINKAKDFGNDMKQKAKDSATNFRDTLVSGLKELPNKMLGIGKNIVEGIWNGIKNAKSWMEGKVKEFAKGILDGIKDSLGIHSPSRVMEKEVGKFLPPGLSNGFISALPKALSVMKEKLNKGVKRLHLDENISVGIDSDVSTSSSLLVNTLKDKYEFLLSWFESIEQRVNKSIQGMILSLQQMQDPSLFFDGIGYVSYEGFTSPQKVKGTDRSNPKSPGNGDIYNFYSPKAIDEVEAARLLKKTKRDIAEGF